MLIKQHVHYNSEPVVMWCARVDDKLNEIIRVLNDHLVPEKKKPLLKKLRALKSSKARLDVKINQIEMELK